MKLRRILSLILACSLAVTMFTVIPAAAADTVITQDNPSGTLTITLKIKGTASVTKAPEAISGLTTSGTPVELVTAGEASGGTMQYSLDGTNYSEDIPTADAAGTYTVYYKAKGNEENNDSEPQTLTVTVGYSGTLTITLEIKADAAVTAAPTAKAGLTTSNGNAVELLETPGTAEGGTMAYSLNGTDYSADIPTADAAGTYTVYYKAIGDEDHNDSEAQTLTVTVGASGALTITLTITPDDVVSNQINALPDADKVTLSDKDAIEAARAAYDALDDDQKALIDEDTYKKLTDAEDALAAAEKAAADQAAADAVVDAFNALPTEVTVNDKDTIEAARAAYDALDDDQKALIDDDTMKKLTDAETALAAAEKAAGDQAVADAVTGKINALPAVADVTYDDKDEIAAARAAYDALTDDQKALIDKDTLKKLTDAEEKIDSYVLLGDANGDGKVTINDATMIQKCIAEFEMPDNFVLKACDTNGDGRITISDATEIQKYVAEYEIPYPIGKIQS